MEKIVGVWRTHVQARDAATQDFESYYLTYLYYVTDSISEEPESRFFGMYAGCVSLREDRCTIVGLDSQDWSKLVGCEVNFSCRVGLHDGLIIYRIYVLNAPEQEAPADE